MLLEFKSDESLVDVLAELESVVVVLSVPVVVAVFVAVLVALVVGVVLVPVAVSVFVPVADPVLAPLLALDVDVLLVEVESSRFTFALEVSVSIGERIVI